MTSLQALMTCNSGYLVSIVDIKLRQSVLFWQIKFRLALPTLNPLLQVNLYFDLNTMINKEYAHVW